MNDPVKPVHDLEGSSPLQRADWLLVLPFIWQLGFAPWANEVGWTPLGLPFAMVWQMMGILFATAVLALRYWLDRKACPRGKDSA